jgi:transposase-like protein
LRRQKSGPPGKLALRADLIADWEETKASGRSLARKYGVSARTAWWWIDQRNREE